MSYEPRGKVKALVDAMRENPARVWTSPEVAQLMDVQQGALTAHLDSAVRNGAIFRQLVNGRCQYSLEPFPEQPSHPRAPQFEAPWTPPKMVAPRAGSEQVRQPQPPVAVALVEEPLVYGSETVESDPQDALTATGEPQEGAEPASFDACVFLDGRMQVWGAQIDEDGCVLLTPEQVAAVKRLVAWRAV